TTDPGILALISVCRSTLSLYRKHSRSHARDDIPSIATAQKGLFAFRQGISIEEYGYASWASALHLSTVAFLFIGGYGIPFGLFALQLSTVLFLFIGGYGTWTIRASVGKVTFLFIGGISHLGYLRFSM